MDRDTPDASLLDAARAGDDQALEALLARYEPAIYRYAEGMCRQPQDAEGVLQDTLLSMARAVEDFRGDAALSTWLYTIARNHCLRRRRRRVDEPAALDLLDPQVTPDSAPSPETAAAGRQLDARVRQAIDALDPTHGEVLWLRDVEGLTAPEVAQVLGIGVGAVKSRLHRARTQVRGALAVHMGDRPPSPTRRCPDVVGLYQESLDGELSADLCGQLADHLADCPHCTETCSELQQSLSLCRRAATPAVPQAVRARVRQAWRDCLRPG